MTQIHHIRKLYYEEGMTISDIAKATNHDRKTIRAKLNIDDWNQEIPVIDQDKKDYPSLEPFKETTLVGSKKLSFANANNDTYATTTALKG